jgi:D-amino peptidase
MTTTAKGPVRLYISADIEGVAGVSAVSHIMPGKHGYDDARRWMTNEVKAVCEAALESGVEQFVISDSHGTGDNILLDELPREAQIVRCWPRPLMMMQGIENGPFVGAALLGYHTGSRHVDGTLAHTISGEILELRVNGQIMSETTLSQLIASYFGVPIILASGDEAYTSHAADVIPGITTATVKWSYSTLSVRSLLPVEATNLLKERTKEALADIQPIERAADDQPQSVELFLKDREKIEALSLLPGFRRVDSHSIAFEVDDPIELSSAIQGLIRLRVPS